MLHYGVANMPGAVPRTSSLALANATTPYAMKIADRGLAAALRGDRALQKGLNTYDGLCTHPAIADTFNLEYVNPELALDEQPLDSLALA